MGLWYGIRTVLVRNFMITVLATGASGTSEERWAWWTAAEQRTDEGSKWYRIASSIFDDWSVCECKCKCKYEWNRSSRHQAFLEIHHYLLFLAGSLYHTLFRIHAAAWIGVSSWCWYCCWQMTVATVTTYLLKTEEMDCLVALTDFHRLTIMMV